MKTFEELDYAQTALGELILRRRRTTRGEEVFEVKLDGAFLMSSLVNTSEIALADLSLEARSGPVTSVLVGGLGLGYTAATVLSVATNCDVGLNCCELRLQVDRKSSISYDCHGDARKKTGWVKAPFAATSQASRRTQVRPVRSSL